MEITYLPITYHSANKSRLGYFEKYAPHMINVLSETTIWLEQVDRAINKQFKMHLKKQFEEKLEEN